MLLQFMWTRVNTTICRVRGQFIEKADKYLEVDPIFSFDRLVDLIMAI
jgi:hypothetical protein